MWQDKEGAARNYGSAWLFYFDPNTATASNRISPGINHTLKPRLI